MALQLQSTSYNWHSPPRFSLPPAPPSKIYASSRSPSPPPTSRRAVSLFTIATSFSGLASSSWFDAWAKNALSDFVELPNSGGVKALDLRIGDGGESPSNGDKVVIHYYGRLAAKQGWRFDCTYDHKDENGEPIPFEFVLGSGKVISGIESAVRSMKVGGIRRVIIPPSQGYQNTSQEPIPPNALFRQTEAIHDHFQSDTSGQRRRLYLGDAYIRHRARQSETLMNFSQIYDDVVE